MDATAMVPPGKRRRNWFFGHPGGLATLAFTEAGIGFSYYGMTSLLTLYMVGYLLVPGHTRHILLFPAFHGFVNWIYGHRDGAALASAITGLYSALAFASPLLGGLVADYALGRTRTIILGAVLMTIGHFLMAFDASFVIALALIIAGMGCGGTIKAQIGGLYAIDDTRRADAFQIYTMALSVAVIIAPLVCGTLGESYHWSWGFAAAGVGMAVGLVVYLAGLRGLPPEPRARQRGTGERIHPPMTGRDWRTVGVLVAMLPVLAVSALGNQEIFNGYLIWGERHYQLVFFGKTMPVSWLLSLDAFISTFTLLISLGFWRWWARRHRDPDEIVKVTIGAAINAVAPAILALASWQAAGGKVGLGWGVAFHAVNDLGFANVYAIGMALYSRAAPPALGATVVNGFVLHIFLANLLVGYLAGFLETMAPARFWLMHTGLIACSAVVLFGFSRAFRDILAPGESTATGAAP